MISRARQRGDMLNQSISNTLQVPEPTNENQRRLVRAALQQVPGYIRDSIAAGMPEDSPQMNQQAVERVVQTLVMNDYADGSMDAGRLSMTLRSIILPLLTRSLRESYLYEDVDQSDVAFFSKEHPEMDIEEIKDILSIYTELMGDEEEKPDPMTAIKDKVFSKFRRKFDHDD